MKALIIGNSDGIGLALTTKLLDRRWEVIGLSRSESPIKGVHYKHLVVDVQDDEYVRHLEDVVSRDNAFDLCVHCVGIGEMLDATEMSGEARIFNVNLTSMVKAAAAVIPTMVERGSGHFIGLSSQADELLLTEAPSYSASKAGYTSYLGSLSLALKNKGVNVTNVRFGFVDTKMAKGKVRPFMMSAAIAADHLLRCVEKKPLRYTVPKRTVPLIKLAKWLLELKLLFSKNASAR